MGRSISPGTGSRAGCKCDTSRSREGGYMDHLLQIHLAELLLLELFTEDISFVLSESLV